MKRSINGLLIIFALMVFIGCGGSAYITSEPSGAKVYVNDGYKGETPLNISTPDKFGPGSIYVFKAEKNGYEDKTIVIKEQGLEDANAAIPSRIHFSLKPASFSNSKPFQQIPKMNETVQNHSVKNNNKNNIFPNTSWAIIVGISEYQYAGRNGLSNLIFANDDAKAFARSLRNLGWSESHMKLLINEQATQRNLMIALKSWLTKAGPDDQIILFWAGHGFLDPEDPEKVYFACYDTDISIPATGYRMDEVRRALEEIGAKNVILLADTCHAGKLITRGDGNRTISVLPNAKKQNLPNGWIFMVGADTDRQAIEHSSWSNGAFTHSLIKGINGGADGFQSAGAKDGIVTMGELKEFMNIAMPDETQRVLGVAKRPVITTSTGDPKIWNLTMQVAR